MTTTAVSTAFPGTARSVVAWCRREVVNVVLALVVACALVAKRFPVLGTGLTRISFLAVPWLHTFVWGWLLGTIPSHTLLATSHVAQTEVQWSERPAREPDEELVCAPTVSPA